MSNPIYIPFTSALDGAPYNQPTDPVHQVRDTSGVMHKARLGSDVPVATSVATQDQDAAKAVLGSCGIGKLLVSEGELARFGMDPIKVVPRVELDEAVRERDEARREAAAKYTILEVGELLAARDARIAELDSRLATFTAANVAPDPPKPMHDFTRVWERDRRRMGP